MKAMMNTIEPYGADLHGTPVHANEALSRQRGIGALEWIGIIAVVALMLYQVLSRTSLMNGANNTVAESSAVSSLYTSTRSVLKSGAGYGANGSDLIVPLYTVGGIPKNLSYNAGTLLNTFGTAYSMVVSNAGFGFTLNDGGLSQADCSKLVVSQSTSGNWTGGITVNGTALGAGPITTQTANGTCTAGANIIAFASLT